MAKILKGESTFNISALINSGVDEEFINDMGQFFFARWGQQGLDDKDLALLNEAIETEHALEELLKDNKPAFVLFLEYQNNRNEAIGINSNKCYEQGFSDGVKFMTVAMGEGITREIETEKLTADYNELSSRAMKYAKDLKVIPMEAIVVLHAKFPGRLQNLAA